jgi:hypothetical protein
MSGLTRRQLLQCLAGCVTSAGTLVLARTVVAGEETPTAAVPAAPDERADRLAEELPAPEGVEPTAFLNRAFRNGGFRNGAFRNGGFRNNAFRNGGFRNGGFRNGAFRNW